MIEVVGKATGRETAAPAQMTKKGNGNGGERD
jgi:hypothetical protein